MAGPASAEMRQRGFLAPTSQRASADERVAADEGDAGRQMVLPATNGQTLRIRKGSTPEAIHREIYRTLDIAHQVMTPVKNWAPTPPP